MKQERFECVPRRREGHMRIAQCFVDYRIGELATCVGCLVGERHAQLEPALRWPNGDRVMWIGERPPELEAEVDASGHRLTYGLAALEPNVIIEARPMRAERVRLRLVREADTAHEPGPSNVDAWLELAAQQPVRKEQSMQESKRYTFNGKTLTVTEWIDEPEATELGLSRSTLDMRIRKGWSFSDAITKPIGTNGKAGRLTKANGDESLERRSKKRATAVRDAVDLEEHLTKKRAPKSNGSPLPASSPSTTAAALLKLAGFSVTETVTPRGVFLFVEEPGA